MAESISLCRPAGAQFSFSLPTLHGFADARLRGGLNNSAPAALGLEMPRFSFEEHAIYSRFAHGQSGFIDGVNFKKQAQGPSVLLARW